MSKFKALALLLFFYLAPTAAMELLTPKQKTINRKQMTVATARETLKVDEKATIDEIQKAQESQLKANNVQDQNGVDKKKDIDAAFQILKNLDKKHQNIKQNKIKAQKILNAWYKQGSVQKLKNQFSRLGYDLPYHEFLMEAVVDLYLDPQSVSNDQHSILTNIIDTIYQNGLKQLYPTKDLTGKKVLLSEARLILGIDENTTRSERQKACVTKLANLGNTRGHLQNKTDYDRILAANAIVEYAYFDDIVQQKKIEKAKQAQDASSSTTENITEQAKNASKQTKLQNIKSSFIYPTFAQAGGAIALLTLLGSGIALHYYLIQPEDAPTKEDNGEDYEDVGEDKKDDDEDARAPESEMVE